MKRFATMWLDGCSGCHMAMLDLDEDLLDFLSTVELVYSPLVDAKVLPEVDVIAIEGAIGTRQDHERLLEARKRSRCLIALGDCAATGNVSGLRNRRGKEATLERVYGNPTGPGPDIPELRREVQPLAAEVRVDLHVPGCPPAAGAIAAALARAFSGETA